MPIRTVRSSARAVASAAFLLAIASGNLACDDEERPPVQPPAGPPPVVDASGRVPNLVCPGSPGCESTAGDLIVGAAARPITPPIETWTDTNADGLRNLDEPFEDLNGNGEWDGVFMAGFSNGRAATGVHDDVWSRVVVLRKGDLAIGMVALDLVGFFHDDIVRIRLAAKDAGLDLDQIVVSTTHTHEAPDTMGIWGENAATSGYDPVYVDETVIARTVEALKEASDTGRAATARLAVTEAPALVNDTRLPDVRDQALSVLQFRDATDASPIATTVFWGNHPEALGSDNTLLTSDYAHFLREEIEARYPSSVAVFFSGSLGGLSTTIGVLGCPSPEGTEGCPQGTWERAEYIGRGAATAGATALDGSGAVDLGVPDIALRRRAFLTTTTNGQLLIAFFIGLLPRNLFWGDTGIQLTPEESDVLVPSDLFDGKLAIQTEVNLLQIGPVAIATVPGELYPELWLARPGGGTYVEAPAGGDYPDAAPEAPLQSLLPAGSVPVIINNGNDALGYILPMSQWDEDPPYAYGETEEPQYGEQNSLGAAMAGTIAAEFAAMVTQ